MTFKVEDINNTKIVHLEGEIDMDVTDKARQTILPLIEAGNEVHVNLSKVSYMDSSGISVLIESHQKALEKSTKVIIKDVSKSVLKVIMMAKLEQILNLDGPLYQSQYEEKLLLLLFQQHPYQFLHQDELLLYFLPLKLYNS